jgi:hypothetical protein
VLIFSSDFNQKVNEDAMQSHFDFFKFYGENSTYDALTTNIMREDYEAVAEFKKLLPEEHSKYKKILMAEEKALTDSVLQSLKNKTGSDEQCLSKIQKIKHYYPKFNLNNNPLYSMHEAAYQEKFATLDFLRQEYEKTSVVTDFYGNTWQAALSFYLSSLAKKHEFKTLATHLDKYKEIKDLQSIEFNILSEPQKKGSIESELLEQLINLAKDNKNEVKNLKKIQEMAEYLPNIFDTLLYRHLDSDKRLQDTAANWAAFSGNFAIFDYLTKNKISHPHDYLKQANRHLNIHVETLIHRREFEKLQQVLIKYPDLDLNIMGDTRSAVSRLRDFFENITEQKGNHVYLTDSALNNLPEFKKHLPTLYQQVVENEEQLFRNIQTPLINKFFNIINNNKDDFYSKNSNHDQLILKGLTLIPTSQLLSVYQIMTNIILRQLHCISTVHGGRVKTLKIDLEKKIDTESLFNILESAHNCFIMGAQVENNRSTPKYAQLPKNRTKDDYNIIVQNGYRLVSILRDYENQCKYITAKKMEKQSEEKEQPLENKLSNKSLLSRKSMWKNSKIEKDEGTELAPLCYVSSGLK